MPRPKVNHTKKGDKSGNGMNDDLMDECSPSPEDETSIVAVTTKKRCSDEMLNMETKDFSEEMQKMLEGFGADMSKTLSSKRKKLEQLTQYSLKSSNKRLDDVWKQQQEQRSKLNEEYHKQSMAVFSQWETDLENTKEQEEKLTALFRQQQKIFQQARAAQTQKLRTLRQLHDQFTKGSEELDKFQNTAQGTIQSELKKEMALLLKRILMETQQQEMANVRKSLHSMLF